MLGGLTIYPVANFLYCIFAKNYENWMTVDKDIAKIVRLTFLAHLVCAEIATQYINRSTIMLIGNF